MLFLDPHHRALYCDWHAKAQVTVAALHQAIARHPADPELEQLVGQLASDSPEFARMWARRPVRTCSCYLRELDHSVVGRVTLANETVTLPDDDQQIWLFYARLGTSDADALTLMWGDTFTALAWRSHDVAAVRGYPERGRASAPSRGVAGGKVVLGDPPDHFGGM
jgi:hypothetical protein